MEKPKTKGRYTIANISVAVVAFIIAFLAVNFFLDRVSKSRFENALESIPLYQTIRKHDPVLYERIKSKMFVMYNEKKSQEQMRLELIDEVMNKLSSRVIYAPDNQIINFVDVLLDDMKYLQSKGQGLCFKFLFPKVDGSVRYSKVMPAEKMQQTLNVYNEFLIATYNVNSPVFHNERMVQNDLELVGYVLYSKYGDKLQQIDNPYARNIDRELICSMSIDFYSEVRKLSDERSAQLLRYLLSQNQ